MRINELGFIPYLLVGLLTSMIGFTIHASKDWAVFDFFVWPVSWCYWLISHSVNLSIVKNTFAFLLE